MIWIIISGSSKFRGKLGYSELSFNIVTLQGRGISGWRCSERLHHGCFSTVLNLRHFKNSYVLEVCIMYVFESMYPNFEYPLKWSTEAATGGVLGKRCYKKFCKIHRKTPVPETLFKKAADLNIVNEWSIFENNQRRKHWSLFEEEKWRFSQNFSKILE